MSAMDYIEPERLMTESLSSLTKDDLKSLVERLRYLVKDEQKKTEIQARLLAEEKELRTNVRDDALWVDFLNNRYRNSRLDYATKKASERYVEQWRIETGHVTAQYAFIAGATWQRGFPKKEDAQ